MDISADDFRNTTFDEFLPWFADQLGVLRNGARDEESSPISGVGATRQHEDAACGPFPSVVPRELAVAHHGWGQSSIIGIKRGYKQRGFGGIDNDVLRGLCEGENRETMDATPFAEMSARIGCFRQQIGGDHWLILFSKQEPFATGSDMAGYARAIANALKVDSCVDPHTEVIVVKFQQG
jgi:hypothetical protein